MMLVFDTTMCLNVPLSTDQTAQFSPSVVALFFADFTVPQHLLKPADVFNLLISLSSIIESRSSPACE
jgi:hypothetical protein